MRDLWATIPFDVIVAARTAGRQQLQTALRASLFRMMPWILLLSPVPGLAADVPKDTPLTLAAAVEMAVRDNATLNSLRARWEAMQERPGQAVALPNPMFSYSGMDMASGGTWPDTGEKRYMLQQGVPGFGKRALREGIAAKDAEAMRQELDAMTREVVMKVKETYYGLYAMQRAIAITQEEEAVLRRMVTVSESMYAAGDRPQTDVLKAQAEITMLKQKLLELQVRENTFRATLNTLLNRWVDTLPGTVAAPPEAGPGGDLKALYGLAVANRPEVQAAQLQVERYVLETQLMGKESMPDYSLGVEYRDVADGANMAMFTVSVELPAWRSKYRASVRESERMRASSEAALEAARRQSELDVQDASFKLQAARQTLQLYRTELVPQAEARFSASEAGYRTGKVDFMDLLESERFLLDARVMTAMAEGDVGMQAARLEQAVGTGGTSGARGAGSR